MGYKREKAIIVEAFPKFQNVINTLYGKIWIRKKDFSILKIEWEQESLENFEEIEKIAKQSKTQPKITFTTEYGYEKNNIRFPNKYSVDEFYLFSQGIKYKKSTIIVVYDNYKFFTVDTKVIY